MPTSGPSDGSASSGDSTPLSPVLVWLTVLVCFGELAVIAVLVFSGQLLESNPPMLPQRHARTPGGTEPRFRGASGPWGELEYTRIVVEPPDEFVPPADRMFEPTRWFFPGLNRQAFEELLTASTLSPAQQSELREHTPWFADTNGLQLAPSASLILGLSPAARSQLYSRLAESPHNDFQAWPYTFRNGGLDAWFRGSGLDAPTLELVRGLTYTRGMSLCFSDLPEVFPLVTNLPERRRLLKTLARNSTLLMKLRVPENADVAALTAYWSRTGRAKDIAPLLDSLAHVPGGASVDVVHLLPPFARKRLNTFPNPETVPPPDCYWTAFNFFKDPPEDRYLDPLVWEGELEKEFEVVTEATFGDIILLLRPDDIPIHAAVYIADHVVFTKNGGSARQPWLLMEWEDLMAHYPQNAAIRPAIFRRKVTARSGGSNGDK